MPRGSPFTAMCRQLAGLDGPRRADLHAHTTASDGSFTPSQVVVLAREAGLKAVAITDHDTLAGIAEARQTATSLTKPEIEVVPGVEITTTFQGRELHLLGYFVDTNHKDLNETLDRTCARRRERFRSFITALAARGATLPEEHVRSVEDASVSLGRRHLSELLVRCGLARTRHLAWQKFVGPASPEVPPTVWPAIEDAITLIREAGGVASLAHPPSDLTDAEFERLRDAGLAALEAEYPWSRSSAGSRLREAAARLGLLISGGSDCHGPEPAHRRIGSNAITSDELERLRERRTAPVSL